MIEHHTAVIAASGTASSEIPANGLLITGIFFPPAFTGTSVTFEAAVRSGGPFYAMVDGAGSSLSRTISAGAYLPLDPALFAGVNFLRVVSGSAEGATRHLLLSVRTLQ